MILFPAFSDVFPVFGLRAKKFRAGFFRVSAVLLYRFGVHLCLFFVTHALMCAYTRPREIYNVGLFPSVSGVVGKTCPSTRSFPATYKNLQKILQKRV